MRSPDTKLVHPDGRSRGPASRLRIAIPIAAALIACALAVPALAGPTPPPATGGCWGTCGGQNGPVDGFFFLAKSGGDYRLKEFTVSEACLGREEDSNAPLSLYGIPTMTAKRSGKTGLFEFSYRGRAQRPVPPQGSASLEVELKGAFVSATKAKVSLQMEYGNCGTDQLTIRHHG